MTSKNLSLKYMYRCYSSNSWGFSLVDIMITIAVIAIITGIAAPNIKGIMQSYRLRTASTDLVPYVNMTKTRAAKHNRQWHIDLNPIEFNGYQVYYNDTGGVKVVVASINFDTCEDKSMHE